MSRAMARWASILVVAVMTCAFAAPANAQVFGLGGSTNGSWDLPAKGQDGSASGVLLDNSNSLAFTMEATLTETGSRRGRTQGAINGALTDTSGNSTWQVFGTWEANKKGSGTFTATIGIVVGNLILEVGSISGKFDGGTFTGTWFFNQY